MEGPPSQKALRALQGGPPAAGPSPSVRPGLRETPGRPTFCTVVPVVSFDSTCPVIRYHRIEINVNSISLLSRTETKCCDILKHLSELAKIRTRPSPFFLHSSSPVNAIPVQLTEQEENEGTAGRTLCPDGSRAGPGLWGDIRLQGEGLSHPRITCQSRCCSAGARETRWTPGCAVRPTGPTAPGPTALCGADPGPARPVLRGRDKQEREPEARLLAVVAVVLRTEGDPVFASQSAQGSPLKQQ